MNRARIALALVLLIVPISRTAASGLAVNVPAGSVRRGEALVTTGGGGRTVRCALCHGDELRGLGRVPAIAGRSPGYLLRQLSDMQKGVRRGLRSDLMSATVARLSEADMVAIAAYVASRRP
jgi:cytochrome c553